MLQAFEHLSEKTQKRKRDYRPLIFSAFIQQFMQCTGSLYELAAGRRHINRPNRTDALHHLC